MGKFRDVVILESLNDFLTQKYCGDEQEGNRQFLVLDVGEGRNDDQHKNNATSTKQTRLEQKSVTQASNQCRQQDHAKKTTRAVFFLNDRTEQKNKGKIAEQMIDISVADDVRKHPRIRQNITKIKLRRSSKPGTGQIWPNIFGQQQYDGAQQSKGENDRRIVLEPHLTPPCGFLDF